MKNKTTKRFVSAMTAFMMTALLLPGCGEKRPEDKDSISVYLWGVSLYHDYAPYIQSQLPDVDIEFVVGNNDLDFYSFLNENGALPDIITTRRFSLHDAESLQGQLMDLSNTNEAGAIYQTYLDNYTNSDGTVNWLPLCGEADGFVANKTLFDKYGISLPTDYDSFVSACNAFEKLGIKGFVSDFGYDYTCMEILQGLSIPELMSLDGQRWRNSYEELSGDTAGLDDRIWPGVFEKMEKFIRDINITEDYTSLSYDPVTKMFLGGEAAIIRETGAATSSHKESGNVDPVFLPYFGSGGDEWILTYPSFHVALNKDLEKNESRKENALRVLGVMMSEEGQNALANGKDVISYSRNVDLDLSPGLENLRPCIEQNHLYIRMASNEFFSASKDVVSKMILGEYDAKQAYDAFNALLKKPEDNSPETVLTIDRNYSNVFSKKGGNESYSVMANSLRELYGSDVLIAPAYSFTGSVIKADYSEKMVKYMVMPNSLEAWQCDMTGAELKDYIKTAVEGADECFTPFNHGSLPVVSGISIKVQEKDGKYILSSVLKDGKEIDDNDTFKVTCLNTVSDMKTLLGNDADAFKKEDLRVREAWAKYITEGGSPAKPENYITLK